MESPERRLSLVNSEKVKESTELSPLLPNLRVKEGEEFDETVSHVANSFIHLGNRPAAIILPPVYNMIRTNLAGRAPGITIFRDKDETIRVSYLIEDGSSESIEIAHNFATSLREVLHIPEANSFVSGEVEEIGRKHIRILGWFGLKLLSVNFSSKDFEQRVQVEHEHESLYEAYRVLEMRIRQFLEENLPNHIQTQFDIVSVLDTLHTSNIINMEFIYTVMGLVEILASGKQLNQAEGEKYCTQALEIYRACNVITDVRSQLNDPMIRDASNIKPNDHIDMAVHKLFRPMRPLKTEFE